MGEEEFAKELLLILEFLKQYKTDVKKKVTAIAVNIVSTPKTDFAKEKALDNQKMIPPKGIMK